MSARRSFTRSKLDVGLVEFSNCESYIFASIDSTSTPLRSNAEYIASAGTSSGPSANSSSPVPPAASSDASSLGRTARIRPVASSRSVNIFDSTSGSSV